MHLRHTIIGELGRRLESGDAFVRCLAAQALGRLGNRAAVPGLLGLLADEDVDVCCDAVAALGALGDRRAVPALLEVYAQAPLGELRLAALDALGRIGGEQAGALLRAVAQERDATWDEVGPVGWDRYWDARRTAVSALGRLGDPSAAPVLARLLADEDGEDVASLALTALAALGPAGAEVVCAQVRGGLPLVRRAAARTAGEQHLAVAQAALLEALKGADPELRVEALRALARLEAPLPGMSWLRLARDADPAVRAAAAGMRTDLPAGSHADGLRALAGDPDGPTRAAALRALAAWHPDGAREVLVAALQDPDPAVLSAAAHGLPGSPDRRAHGILCAVARCARYTLPRRLAALEALEAFPREWSAPLWHELLADEQGAMRLTCLRALCRAGDPEAGALLAAVLRGEVVPAQADPGPPPAPGERTTGELGRDAAALAAPSSDPPPRSTVEALLRPAAAAAESGQEPAPATLELDESERECLALVEENLRTGEQGGRAHRLPVHTELRVQAAHLVGSEGVAAHGEVVAALIAMLAGTETPLRVAAAEALGRLATRDAIEPLRACLDALDPEVRLAAVRSLGRIGRSDDLQAIYAAWPDRDHLVRREQVRVLGATPAPANAQLLRQALADPEASVVQASAMALLEHGCRESLDDVLAAIGRFPDRDWSGLGERLLSRAGERAFQALGAWLDDPHRLGGHALAISLLEEMARTAAETPSGDEPQPAASHG
ncbi:MAG: HEAT repeat domain-containing protein [Candidatus Lambdaproteobacteria bacterium]|nr:HEAT repeat domain-containing protein [Candidatus Lambdaproteobacteria bacterium]